MTAQLDRSNFSGAPNSMLCSSTDTFTIIFNDDPSQAPCGLFNARDSKTIEETNNLGCTMNPLPEEAVRLPPLASRVTIPLGVDKVWVLISSTFNGFIPVLRPLISRSVYRNKPR